MDKTKLTVEFINYKLIKSLRQEFESGNVYIVGGGNAKGKTSFIQGIQTIIEGQNNGKDIVSFGEKEGKVSGEFKLKGGDNNIYKVIFEFNEQGKDKFTLINPDTSVSKSNSRTNTIADVFKYNTFTVDEFLSWGLTAEGRRKQASIILEMFEKSIRDRILEIDILTNTKDGEIFLQRKEANKDYDSNKKAHDSIIFSEEEKAKLVKGKETKKVYDDLVKQYETALESNASNAVLQEKKNNLILEKESIPEKIDELNADAKDKVTNIDSEILELEEKIQKLKEKKGTIIDNTITEETKLQQRSKDIDKEISVINEKLPKDSANIIEMKGRIDKGKIWVEDYNKLCTKNEQKDELLKNVQASYKKVEELEKKLKEYNEEKKNLLTNSNLPVKNIVIDNGEAFYVDPKSGELLSFTEASLSYATAGIIVARIMAHINQTLPIWLVGKAAEYDDKSFNELIKIAEQYGGIVFADKVTTSNEPLSITCYEKRIT